jgi:hypothetical protein
MTVALIVIGVVAFVALDVYLFWRFFGSGNRDALHGNVPAPGHAQLKLPAGRVKLTYQELKHSSSGGEHDPIQFWVPADLEITIAPAVGGDPLTVERAGGHSAQSVAGFLPGGPRSRVKIGHVEVLAEGHYLVTVSGPAEGVTPSVLVGR